MRTIHLYGAMGERFGRRFQLAVGSVREALLALGAQLPGFRAAIEEGRFRISCGPTRRRGFGLDAETLAFGLPAGDIHVTPVVRGRGGGSGASIGKIIVGTIIAAATWWAVGPAWAISLGAGMALSGASTLLTPKKKAKKEGRSYMIGGVGANAQEGGCVPFVFGTCWVSPITISAGVTVSDSNGFM